MPKLSIIVPTRERSDTLIHTIRTLVSQDYGDCEFLVSDNASQDATRDVVSSFSDHRIRYINTGSRLSMSDNWEFALGMARGEFVTYIGDDDGFIPGAVAKAMRLLEESRMSALAWDKVAYNWPDYTLEGKENWVSMRAGSSNVYVAESRKRLAKLLQFRDGFAFSRLPGVYHGVVRKSLTENVKDGSANGIFFNSIAPDVFSAIALGMALDKYLLSEYPFTVQGCSRHSTGASFAKGKFSDPNSSISKFMSEVSRETDPRIKLAPAVETAVMAEYLLAKRSLPKFDFPEPPWDRYVHSLIRRAKGNSCAAEILQSASHTVKELGLKIKVPDLPGANGADVPIAGMAGDILKFKVPVELVSNIYDACLLVEGMLPGPSDGDGRSAVARFIRNINRCLVSEAKSLYRSL